MPKGLPKDVLNFLLEDARELERVKSRMKDVELERTRSQRDAEEQKRRAKLPLQKCSGYGYGCGNQTRGDYPCPSCLQEYLHDPDAFK